MQDCAEVELELGVVELNSHFISMEDRDSVKPSNPNWNLRVRHTSRMDASFLRDLLKSRGKFGLEPQ
jgi:hypothetical protein